jgi:predicted metal-dependent phosphoesterase TrpH
MLKSDLHTHTSEDPLDALITYNSQDLIKYMAKQKYEVLSITLHNTRFFSEDLRKYAEQQGILLIPGMEVRMNHKDILIINPPEGSIVPTTWRGIRRLKDEGALVIAPHPFFIVNSLGKNLVPRIKMFDAIEVSHWYHKYLNRNKMAIELAKDFNLPMIGTSDCHRLSQVGNTYTNINSDKNKDSVLEAIRKNQLEVITRPLNTLDFLKVPALLPFDLMARTFFNNAGKK